MWTAERIALAYFVYLAAVSWIRPIGTAPRRRLHLVAAALVVAIWRLAAAPPAIRMWAPAAYILAGYYASSALFVAPSPRLERWLLDWDRRLLGDPAIRFARWPRLLLAALEVVYMGCFLVVGGGFLILALNGFASAADHYWTLVLATEFGSFGALAFLQSRPPWAIERKPVLADRVVHDLATAMNRRVSIQVNTLPSGHVAASLAAALAVMTYLPWIGTGLLLLALFITVATVAGRYHYVVDAVAGIALAVVVWALRAIFASF